ncbi:MAG: sugar kinase [Kiritimatiellae bacterium]|nr:sugar kinase [Verrucomicrobiota bacterium]MBU4286003.1 sugar kinase [Verrucomicrobiota bacterium]MBU4366162.1 sugar kinase [Verrucomicrobiota bacterium]MCG2660800.1 sugar kinase [Kiritimatiellia bacterium]
MPRINCLGVLVVDALSGPLSRYPEPRVCSQVVTQSVRFAAGGGAANTGNALAKLGLDVGVFSKVGDDPNGAFLRSELAQAGVDTRGIRVAAGESTPFTFVGIHPDGDRTFIHTPGANRTFSPADLDLEALFAADILLYQDCWVLPQLDGEPGARLLAEARRRGLKTALDECWGLGPRRDVLETMLPHCTYFLPSVDDLRTIYPDWPPERLVAHFLSLGVESVVLKMGSAGCLVARGAERIQVSALHVRVVDTTGAGDCWDAGFLAALMHGEDVVAATRIGHACAAYCIEHIGGAAGIPDYASACRRAQ